MTGTICMYINIKTNNGQRQRIFKLYIYEVEMAYYCPVGSCDYLGIWFEATHLNNTLWTEFIWSFVEYKLWVINSRLTCHDARAKGVQEGDCNA